jgi:transcriptional regulator of stress and heat shock response
VQNAKKGRTFKKKKNFLDYEVLTQREAMLIRSATSDKMLMAVDIERRDKVRANRLKHRITSLMI